MMQFLPGTQFLSLLLKTAHMCILPLVVFNENLITKIARSERKSDCIEQKFNCKIGDILMQT
jgi:hypothetical protein